MTEDELQHNGVNDPPELDGLEGELARYESTVVGCAIALMAAIALILAGVVLAVGYFTR